MVERKKRYFLKGKGYIFPFLFFFLFWVQTEEVKAAGNLEIIEMNDPYKIISIGPYYENRNSSDGMYFMFEGRRAYTLYWQSGGGTEKTKVASQYGWTHMTGIGFNCNTSYTAKVYDKSGNTLIDMKVKVTGLINPSCDSGGDGSLDGAEGVCDVCGIFDCPEWDNYLGKLDDIKNAIPPPPNWNEVSQIFSDAIVPPLIDGTRVMLDDLLGRAPEPPTPPANMPTMPDLPSLDDGGFKDKEPDLPDSGVKGFDSDEIIDNAPELNYEEDDSGGFDLSVDPVDNLPDVYPGGDPGPYKRDPVMMDAEPPGSPKEFEGDIGKPSNPKDDAGSPPKPDGDMGKPPTPGGNAGAPPKPGDNGERPPGYMPKPK